MSAVPPAVDDDGAVLPPGEPTGLRLTVSAVARRMGVAPATLRTWDRRYGLGPGEHSSGTHRRYAPEDVARLEVMQRALVEGATPAEAARLAVSGPRPAAAPTRGPATQLASVRRPTAPSVEHEDTAPGVGAGAALRMPGAGRQARGLGRAALALDGDVTVRLLQTSVHDIGVIRTWDEVARPVLRAVADRWSRTGLGIEVEHMLSEAVTSVMARVAFQNHAPASVRPVLLGSMPGEHHSLPLRVLAATLAERGVGASLLGADLPGTALAAAITRTAPSAVFLWSQAPESADAALVGGLPRTRPRTRCYVGGPGWDTSVLPRAVVPLGSLGEAGNVLTAAAGL
ncbi:cobalamin B12-binding domain-containing protein [Rhodococcus antarcticus]|uniref:Cobalamin B12-binding domain-containing protein n=1 Tax=Rhodococcus antarcticus TaxID=2987751 RepID=A0ABY6P161_9NOCA|nr:MerR family transcriptional regulator [Rhodococcus antarcticus]UZJ25380.1 cobalamin B12-binding domain-containing protein [Rhodococcus antarcticus]